MGFPGWLKKRQCALIDGLFLCATVQIAARAGVQHDPRPAAGSAPALQPKGS